jgi:RNA polymerase sigma-70 factor (ECF subfamily)
LERPSLLGEADAAAQTPAAPLPLDLRALFETHYASIWRLLKRFGVVEAQLDDAAQEVFWVAARRLADIQPGSEHTFLFGVALRVASNTHRRQKTLPPMTNLEALVDTAALGPTPEQELEQRRARQLLEAILDQLPLELRTVLVLFELEGMPVKDIADIEGIPMGTASSRLRRAREEFQALTKRVRALLSSPKGDR